MADAETSYFANGEEYFVSLEINGFFLVRSTIWKYYNIKTVVILLEKKKICCICTHFEECGSNYHYVSDEWESVIHVIEGEDKEENALVLANRYGKKQKCS